MPSCGGDAHKQEYTLRADILGHGTRLRSFRHLVWYEETEAATPGDGVEIRRGRIAAGDIPVPDDADAYLCGPVAFMQAIRADLQTRGVPADRIRYEVFGPDQWTSSLAASGSK